MTGPFPTAVRRFPKLRQSRLATFDRCALSSHFDEEYTHDWSTHPQVRGQIFHRFAAKALRAMSEMNERQIPTDLAVEILDECLRMEDIDKVCPLCEGNIVSVQEGKIVCAAGHEHTSDFGNLPMSEIKDLRWVVVKFATDNSFDIENLVDIEKRLNATVRYPAGDGSYIERLLTGQLDALFVAGENDEEAIVIDYKDTWGLPAPAEVGFDGYFQQRFYGWLVMRNYPPIQRVTLREHYVRYSDYREATVYRADMDDIEAELGALAMRFDRAHERRHFPPSPGKHCQFCPRPAACPIFPGVRGEGMILDEETALRTARELEVAVATVAQRRKALEAWASVRGPVPISSHKGPRVWGHKEVKRVSRPKREEIEKTLALKGGRPLTREDLDRLYRESKGTRFEQHTPPPEPMPDPDPTDALIASLEASLKQADEAG